MDSKNHWTIANTCLKKMDAKNKNYADLYRKKNPFRAFKMMEYPSNVSRAKKIFTRFRSVISDQNRRSQFEKLELESQIVKSIFAAERLTSPQNSRQSRLSQYALQHSRLKKLAKPFGSICRVRNRCVISGRSSIIGITGFSRIKFRQLAGAGKIPGLLKL